MGTEMSTSNYKRGVALEYDIVHLLRSHGWEVQRSAGSRGLFDVVGVKKGRRNWDTFYFCFGQCKRKKVPK